MGDVRRFDRFADYIAERWPDRATRIIDVAGGKGGLHAALYRLGYRKVTTYDTRRKKAHRPYYRCQPFTERTRIREGADLIVAMHPDEATDVAMAWAIKQRVPFAVVPCCIKPTAWDYDAGWDYDAWCEHLRSEAEVRGASVVTELLPIKGRALVLSSAAAAQETETP